MNFQYKRASKKSNSVYFTWYSTEKKKKTNSSSKSVSLLEKNIQNSVKTAYFYSVLYGKFKGLSRILLTRHYFYLAL